jgi:hypothetical protein
MSAIRDCSRVWKTKKDEAAATPAVDGAAYRRVCITPLRRAGYKRIGVLMFRSSRGQIAGLLLGWG